MRRVAILAAGSVLLAFGSAAMADGESIYKSGTSPTCASCHDRGTAGAPMVNKPADWEGIELDSQTLVESTLSGKGAMPTYEGRVDKEEIVAAIEYMISTVE